MKLSHLRLSLLSLGFLLPGLTQCTTPGTTVGMTGSSRTQPHLDP